MQTCAKCLNELELFAPEDIAIDALRVGRFWRGLRGEICLMCCSARVMTYIEKHNMNLSVEVDQEAISKLSVSISGFEQARGVFRGRGAHRGVSYDPPL